VATLGCRRVLVETVEAPVTLGDHDLRHYREAHPLAAVFPLLDDMLGQSARACDAVMAVSDAAGRLMDEDELVAFELL
jgi:hypothetical protein